LDKDTSKIRIYDIAKEYKISSDALLKVLRGLGFVIKSHMSVASEDMLDAIADKFKHEIEEVKKDDESRKKKIQEQEARKRREEAEKNALKRKTEAKAKRKIEMAEKEAKAKAAQEIIRAREEIKIVPPPVVEHRERVVERPRVEQHRPMAAEAPTAPREIREPAAPVHAPRPAVRPPQPPRESEHHKAAAPQTGVRVTPDAARQLEKKLQQSIGVSRSEKKKKKRERGKKGQQHKVDTAAVKLSFKKTMASLDGAKKVKKYKRRTTQEEGEIDTGAPTIEVTEFMTLAELAKVLDKKPAELIGKCMELGMLASINQRLDMDTIETLALEFGYNIREVEEVGSEVIDEEEETNLQPRPPVVTIMGHVDHGKTTLLDFIRKSDIVSGEAGRITQHIGAYEVRTSGGGSITFLDTPGHEAFSAMRARGAQVTDIVILVVSAVEAVMPQTVEAINHARAAGVPILVAINKIDLPNANTDTVRQQLAHHNLLDESWGGKTIMVELSAKTGKGVDKLLEMILLQAEVMELKADPSIKAQGTVIEARLEKGLGPVITVLVQKGTLALSQPFVAGSFKPTAIPPTNY